MTAMQFAGLKALNSNESDDRHPVQNMLCTLYEGHAKSSVTNRLPKFYPRYILKCFTALEWCVE